MKIHWILISLKMVNFPIHSEMINFPSSILGSDNSFPCSLNSLISLSDDCLGTLCTWANRGGGTVHSETQRKLYVLHLCSGYCLMQVILFTMPIFFCFLTILAFILVSTLGHLALLHISCILYCKMGLIWDFPLVWQLNYRIVK